MSVSVIYHQLARADPYTASAWYEDQQPGLGDRFAASVDRIALRATRWPNSGTPTLRDEADEIIERKLATPGFPYTVRYRVVETTLVVMAVSYQHRRPEYGADREP